MIIRLLRARLRQPHRAGLGEPRQRAAHADSDGVQALVHARPAAAPDEAVDGIIERAPEAVEGVRCG